MFSGCLFHIIFTRQPKKYFHGKLMMSFMQNLIQDYKNSYTYLFKDKDFYQKLWLLPVLLFFPFIGLIFIKGWQVQMVQDIAYDKPLQKINFSNTLIKGIQITGATIFYFIVPVLICYLSGLKGLWAFILDITEFIRNGMEGYLYDILQDYLLTFMIYMTWGIISTPILQSGIIRYALNHRWQALFNIPINMILLIRHAHHFLKFQLYYGFTVFIFFMMELFFIPILPLAMLLTPIFMILYYGATSYELGRLAQTIRQRQLH